MLTLRSSPASPFVRKIRIAANVLGLERDIAIEPADTMNPHDSVRRQNPLGKIPALVLEDGTVLFDSRVILDYLDHRAGGGRIVPAPPALTATPDVGQIALACALGYRDFRFEGTWRRDHPRLVAWLDEFAGRVPAFAATKPQG